MGQIGRTWVKVNGLESEWTTYCGPPRIKPDGLKDFKWTYCQSVVFSSWKVQKAVQFNSPNQPYLVIPCRPLSRNRKLWRPSTLKLTLGFIIFAYLCYPLVTLWIGYISEWMWNIYFCVWIWLFTQIKPLAKNCESLAVWISLLLWRELNRVLCSIMQGSTDQNRWVPNRTRKI